MPSDVVVTRCKLTNFRQLSKLVTGDGLGVGVDCGGHLDIHNVNDIHNTDLYDAIECYISDAW